MLERFGRIGEVEAPVRLGDPPQHVGFGSEPFDSHSLVGQLGHGGGQEPAFLVWRGGGRWGAAALFC